MTNNFIFEYFFTWNQDVDTEENHFAVVNYGRGLGMRI